MNQKEFLTHIKNSKQVYWFIEGPGFIRGVLDQQKLCPVQIVHLILNDKKSTPFVYESGKELGLRARTVHAFVKVADLRFDHNPHLRKSMLKACGLKEL